MENEYVQDVEAYLNEPVKIRLFRDNDRYRDRVYVAVNGRNCLIERGKWITVKRKFALVLDQSDATVADLMTDGCNMGIKSLRKYLNQYPAAENRVKKIAEHLIDIEEEMTEEMQGYL